MKYEINFEDRTLAFAIQVIQSCKKLTVNTVNRSILDQLVRSSSSVGANYREANSAITHKDCLFRMRIARKEAKETLYWLTILFQTEANFIEGVTLSKEATELVKILSAMIANKKKYKNEF